MELIIDIEKKLKMRYFDKNSSSLCITNDLELIRKKIMILPDKYIKLHRMNNAVELFFSNCDYIRINGEVLEINLINYKDFLLNLIIEQETKIKKLRVNRLRITAAILAFAAVVSTSSSSEAEYENPEPKSVAYVQPEPTIESENNLDYFNPLNLDLLTRIEQSKENIDNSLNSVIPLGQGLNEYTLNKIVKFIQSEKGEKCFILSNKYGVDPYLLVSLFMTESSLEHENTIPGGKYYNGSAVGIAQLEKPNDRKITAKDRTGEEITKTISMTNAINIDTNMELGIMYFQNVLDKYKGNNLLALQSYNYGKGLMDLIISLYADENGRTYEEVVSDYTDIGWMKYLKEVHDNPQEFASRIDLNKYDNYSQTINFLKNWKGKTYGNDDYIGDVFRYYIGNHCLFTCDGKTYDLNFKTMECIKMPKLEFGKIL